MTLFDVVRDVCIQQGFEKTYWLAYSGGMDSHVLLTLFAELRREYPLKLRAIHINHGLSQHAATWAAHCARVCQAYQIDYLERAIHIDLTSDESLEESARRERYAVFADCLEEGDLLLTAHQQDDQAETVLLQLLRGAGPKGLAAMPAIKAFAKGRHARPLLTIPRSQLQDYAKLHQLEWIEDESNQNTCLTRNFIRHDVLSLLKTRWPTVTGIVARSGAHCAEAQVLLEDYAVGECKNAQGSRLSSLSVTKLLMLSPAKQRLVLRTWIEQQGYRLPGTKKIMSIQQDVLTASCDRLPVVNWAGAELRRYRDDLYLMQPLIPANTEKQYPWELANPLHLTNQGKLTAALAEGKGLHKALQQVSVRFRQGGEVAKYAKRGTHTLKNLFQEWGVLPWERDRIPLLFDGEELICVVGYFIHEAYAVLAGEMGWEPCWTPIR